MKQPGARTDSPHGGLELKIPSATLCVNDRLSWTVTHGISWSCLAGRFLLYITIYSSNVLASFLSLDSETAEPLCNRIPCLLFRPLYRHGGARFYRHKLYLSCLFS